MEIVLCWLIMAGEFLLNCVIGVVTICVGGFLLYRVVGIVIVLPLMVLAFGVQAYNLFMSWKTGDPCYGNGDEARQETLIKCIMGKRV